MGASVLITTAAFTVSPLVVKEVSVVLFPTGQNVNAVTVLGKYFYIMLSTFRIQNKKATVLLFGLE